MIIDVLFVAGSANSNSYKIWNGPAILRFDSKLTNTKGWTMSMSEHP